MDGVSGKLLGLARERYTELLLYMQQSKHQWHSHPTLIGTPLRNKEVELRVHPP